MAENSSSEVKSVLESIPFGNIIGGPLRACIMAQKEASASTLQYLKETCMSDSDIEYKSVSPETVSFSFIIDGQRKTMAIPLLTIVPIPYIHIGHVDLSFTADIKSCSRENMQAVYTSASAEVKATEETETNIQNLIQVDIHASTSEMPSGIAKLLELFGGQLIQVETLSPEEVEKMKKETAILRERDVKRKKLAEDRERFEKVNHYIDYRYRYVYEIYGFPTKYTEKLDGMGVWTVSDFLNVANTASKRQNLASKIRASEEDVLRWANYADLMRIPRVSPGLAALLEASGVDTVKELKNRNASTLVNKMRQKNMNSEFVNRVPAVSEMTYFITKAKGLKPMLEY